MLIQRVNGTDADKVFINVHNSTGAVVSTGYLACFHVRTAASANGVDIEKPVTSALPAFAGVIDSDSIAADGYGLCQTYGYSNKAYCSASGGETLAPGQVIGPVTGQWYANSAGLSTNLGPIIILSQRAGGATANPVFIRAL